MQPLNPGNANAALAGGGAAKDKKTTIRPLPNKRNGNRNQALIATITKSHSCQLRVMLTTWRGQTKVELADFTSVISGVYFQAGAGISVPLEKLPELIEALKAVRP